jgi:carboxymethylenebutenolidase
MPETSAVRTIDIPGLAEASAALTGEFVAPAGEGPWPGVVLVHEAFGINDVMRRQAERFARAGYLALMPDLFTEGGARKCLNQTFREISSGTGRSFADIESARQLLIARDDCTGAVGIIGFCMGGGFALAAASRGFAAASVNYGRLPKPLDESLVGACPIVGSYGGIDGSLKGAARMLEASLTRLGIEHDVKEYPGAGHSFLNDAESGPPAIRFLFKRFLGAGPNPEAAADAWSRIDTFFTTHLTARG